MLLDLVGLCKKYGISSRGVVHIGAHECTEFNLYPTIGMKKIVLVEANPVVFARLKKRVEGIPNVLLSNCAIANYDGEIVLHVTSNDESSSVLPLGYHKVLYPHIVETAQITVPCRKIDTLLEVIGVNPADISLINIDIQGAELLAFQGAQNLLMSVEAIVTEINNKELYEGCALTGQLDEFLGRFGFERKETNTPFDPSWGDAFYVKIQ